MLALLNYDFIRYAVFAGLLIGFIVPLLGVFIVVRKQALVADALSHVTLSGIAIGLYVSSKQPGLAFIPPIAWGMGASILGAVSIEKLRFTYRHFQELAIPIIMSAGIGIGVIFIGLAEGFTTDLFGYLFGSVSAVTKFDFYTIVIVSIVTVLTIVFFYQELFALSFDEEHAQISGLRNRWIHYMFIILVAVVVASAMRVVGILLVSSLITLPVAASMRYNVGFIKTIGLSILFGEIAVIGGLFSALWLDLSPGGVIVVWSVVILLLSIVFTKNKGGSSL
ncbi:MAG: metal ABC transporter permease [Bacilli bacterium]